MIDDLHHLFYRAFFLGKLRFLGKYRQFAVRYHIQCPQEFSAEILTTTVYCAVRLMYKIQRSQFQSIQSGSGAFLRIGAGHHHTGGNLVFTQLL